MVFNVALSSLNMDDIVACIDPVRTLESSRYRTLNAGCDDICTFTVVENVGHPWFVDGKVPACDPCLDSCDVFCCCCCVEQHFNFVK